ncbi:hypothetical protein V1T75_05195 [Tenacibaculum sp. FZY0031]|uniref:hypothetical protein n=1 Tax=Tenacibaculum sp. FZY0031 TaxID=3116648 RepID=UPI002EBE0CD7|nr:hypothetical protein [Tenacibaculum sp. FZY0031]
MSLKKHSIFSKIASLSLVILLMLPILIKATHHHENEAHHHNCKEKSTHLHESVNDHCDICYFSFTSFDVPIQNSSQVVTILPGKTIVDNYKSVLLPSCYSLNRKLRGPPTNS